MKYYLIAGEASGDLHASNLMAALRDEDPQAEFRFFGGDLMRAVGGTCIMHYREMAYMGIIPVVLHARTIARNMRLCRDDIRAWRPDVVIPVDYPGFNLRIARYVHDTLRLPICYYISPKIWAWKRGRIHTIRRTVDRMLCILPFETDFYRSLDYAVDYVGNPSVDAVEHFRRSAVAGVSPVADDGRPLLAILAGSRRNEIAENLPTMLDVARRFPTLRPVVAGAPGLTMDDYRCSLGRRDALPEIVFDRTYELLAHAHVALVTSGTATLEAALFRVPQVVCYAVGGGRLANYVFDHFFRVPYISLVNLIVGEPVVPELFGGRFTRQRITDALSRLTDDTPERRQMLDGYDRMIQRLGPAGASQRAARVIATLTHSGTRPNSPPSVEA